MDKISCELRPHFLEPLSVPTAVTTAISPIRAPSPCGDCGKGIRRSNSCDDCLNQKTPHPPTPVAQDSIEIACRTIAGDDTVEAILNPVGMALEYAATDESIARLQAIGEELQKKREKFESELLRQPETVVRISEIETLYWGSPDALETICERTGLQVVKGKWCEYTVCFYDPKAPTSAETLRKREGNGGKCYQCQSDQFATDSAFCWDCYLDPNPEGHFCTGGCGRMITEGHSCRPCDEREDALRREQELLNSLLEEDGCPGCGIEGWGGEYCCRACMLERAGVQ